MLENYCVTWGGRGNLLLPVDDSGLFHESFWPLVQLFDADVWAAYQPTYRGQRTANPAAFEALVEREAERFSSDHNVDIETARHQITEAILDEPMGASCVTDELRELILQRTAPAMLGGGFHFSHFAAGGAPGRYLVDARELTPRLEVLRYPETEHLPLSLRLLVAAGLGALSGEHIATIEQSGTRCEPISIERNELALVLRMAWLGATDLGYSSTDGPLATAIRKAGTSTSDPLTAMPVGLSLNGCARMWRDQPAMRDSPVTVVVGDSAADFAYAHALDRCGLPAFWLPGEFVGDSDEDGLSRLVVDNLARCLRPVGRRRLSDKPVQIMSLSLDADVLAEARECLHASQFRSSEAECPSVVEGIQIPARRPGSIFDPTLSDDVFEEPFRNDEMERRLAAKVPAEVTAEDPWNLSWWIDVGEDDSCLPSRSCLAELLIAEPTSFPPIHRASVEGVTYYSHPMGPTWGGQTLDQLVVRPRLRFPGCERVFQHLFQHAGYATTESQAGRFRRLTTELWGGLDALHSDLANRPISRLLHHWATGDRLHAAKSSDDGFTIRRTTYLAVRDAARVSGQTQALTRELLDSYLTRGIARRAYLLKCVHCLSTDWYQAGSFGQSFACNRCGTESFITRGTWPGAAIEPVAYYDLAEVATQALRGNVAVPVAALHRLKSDATSFYEVPELEIENADGKSELDLLAIVDGRIVIGEAKKSDRLHRGEREPEWLRRFVRVAEAVTADEVVLATATKWRELTAQRISSAFTHSRVRAVVFEDLAP